MRAKVSAAAGTRSSRGRKASVGNTLLPGRCKRAYFSEVSRIASAAGHRLEGVLPERLKRPAAGAVHHHPAHRAGDQRFQFEQAYPQGLDLRLAQRRGQAVPKQRHQIVGAGMQQQTKGVGQKTLTAQAVGGESVLQFGDTVFTLAPVLIEVENFCGGARAVGDDITQGAAAGAVLGFDADAARALPPALAAMPEAAVENVPLGVAQVAALGFFRQRLAAPLKGRMVPMPKLYWISQRSQNSYSAGMAKPASPTRRMGTPGNSRCSQRTRRRNTATRPRELPTSPRRRCAASRYPVCRSKPSRG